MLKLNGFINVAVMCLIALIVMNSDAYAEESYFDLEANGFSNISNGESVLIGTSLLVKDTDHGTMVIELKTPTGHEYYLSGDAFTRMLDVPGGYGLRVFTDESLMNDGEPVLVINFAVEDSTETVFDSVGGVEAIMTDAIPRLVASYMPSDEEGMTDSLVMDMVINLGLDFLDQMTTDASYDSDSMAIVEVSDFVEQLLGDYAVGVEKYQYKIPEAVIFYLFELSAEEEHVITGVLEHVDLPIRWLGPLLSCLTWMEDVDGIQGDITYIACEEVTYITWHMVLYMYSEVQPSENIELVYDGWVDLPDSKEEIVVIGSNLSGFDYDGSNMYISRLMDRLIHEKDEESFTNIFEEMLLPLYGFE